ncbi:MAG: hypothetical protein EU549_00430 [Promethearchaeota archaeon]|nr:MAG: hypothetical protein EU549_00430 [Candidatus Lokiarchaeota archaeon]
MTDLSGRLYGIASFVKKKQNEIFHLISFLALLLTFLFLINLIDLGILQNFIGLYIILLFPTYPLFFNLVEKDKLILLEKFVFTIISNLSFYVIIGFFGNLIGIYLNGFFFFYTTFGLYAILASISIYLYNKRRFAEDFTQINNSRKVQENSNNFSYRENINKPWISKNKNKILLAVFLMLLCILYFTLVPNLNNTDAWIHITIIKIIDIKGYLPVQDYYGAMGIHIYSTVFHFFSNLDIFFISRYFLIYSILFSSLILYMIFKKIFKNNNLAIFGVFIMEFSSLGFIRVVNNFWPTALAFFQSILIFYILYARGYKFMEFQEINFEKIRKNMISSYILIIILFIGSLLTHSLITIIMLISYLWLYLIYFIRDFRRGVDFIVLLFLGFLVIVFFGLGIGTGHIEVLLVNLNYPFYYYILAIGALAVILFPVIRKLVRGIKFGRKEIILQIKEKKKEKKIETKYVIPIIISIVCLLTVILLIINDLILNINIQSLFTIVEIFLFASFGTWGFIWFQKSSRGEILYIWYIGFAIILMFAFLYDVFIVVSTIWPRIIEICSVVVAIGFISYFYKIIKMKIIDNNKVRLFLVSLIVISLIISISEISYFAKLFSLEEKEIENIETFSKYTSERKIIICEFGERAAFIYYDYPYQTAERDFQILDVHLFLLVNAQYLKPENHIYENGTNILSNLKKDYEMEVYILLTQYYFQFGSWSFYDGLSDKELAQYYNLTYLNRIFSSKAVNGEEKPIYWVI